MNLHVHSIETLGGVDGPGVRCVIFLQGCPLRCLYCQNPDTQPMDGGREMAVPEIMHVIRRTQPYFGKEGGVTLSGGEPLVQAIGSGALLRACREAGIHTAIDTSGACVGPEALKAASLADLLLLDIKHPDSEKCAAMTGAGLDSALTLLHAAEALGQAVWIRHVVVPGWSDTEETMQDLARLLTPFSCIRRIELLPYHTLGAGKYATLGRTPPLDGTPPASVDLVAWLQRSLHGFLSAAPPTNTKS